MFSLSTYNTPSSQVMVNVQTHTVTHCAQTQTRLRTLKAVVNHREPRLSSRARMWCTYEVFASGVSGGLLSRSSGTGMKPAEVAFILSLMAFLVSAQFVNSNEKMADPDYTINFIARSLLNNFQRANRVIGPRRKPAHNVGNLANYQRLGKRLANTNNDNKSVMAGVSRKFSSEFVIGGDPCSELHLFAKAIR
uniref:Uncharacterized protein n=1 Tax=Ascaris lumbricoides TaxID=6252 RepID=A0A0M3HQC7_ASCLU